MSDWTSRRILRELADPATRRAILAEFWRHADNQSRMLAQMHLARALHFRDETIRKMPPEKKADLLASRIGASEFDQFLDIALMAYHTQVKSGLMAAFLDQWKIPHVNGSIEVDDYPAPNEAQVREAVAAVELPKEDVRLYLAAAGLLMGDDWRAATWPVVDEMASGELAQE
jgi:hypothetical protein